MTERDVERRDQDVAVPQADPVRESFVEAQGWKAAPAPDSDTRPGQGREAGGGGGGGGGDVTVITETVLRSGREEDWDRAYRERAADAAKQDGWVDLHLLVPEDEPRRRVVVGTWRDRGAWERWHQTETFERTRKTMNDATEDDGSERWFRVATERASG